MEKTPPKVAIIIVVGLLIYAVIIGLIFYGKEEEPKKPDDKKPEVIVDSDFLYLILSPGTFWQYKNGQWSEGNDKSIYRTNQFLVYNDNSYVGKYYFSYNEKWYLFDQDDNFYNYEIGANIIGLYGNFPYIVSSFIKEQADTSDWNYIKDYLATKEISTTFTDLNPQKILFDYDGDSILETIYITSNAFNSTLEANKTFGYVFAYDDGKYLDIYGYTGHADDIFNVCSPTVQNIIDIDVNKQAALVVRCDEFSSGGTCQTLFQYQDGKFIQLKTCD